MTPQYTVRATPRFTRLLRALNRQHSELAEHYAAVLTVLKDDPYNLSRTHSIKKLTNVKAGDGQYRIRSGRFRFRYDIYGQEVVLQYCGLRREDTYR
jgi:mRNA-degrading endonuclease RelE of RelBE toxin-antitoxin system